MRLRREDGQAHEVPVEEEVNAAGSSSSTTTTSRASAKKKAVGSRLWIRMDRLGQLELIVCDKSVSVPIFSHSARIHGITSSTVAMNSMSSLDLV